MTERARSHGAAHVAAQGTERFELWRDDKGSAPGVDLSWWYRGNLNADPCKHYDSVSFGSIAAMTAAMQAATREHGIRMDVNAGFTASGRTCIVVTRGDHNVPGRRGSYNLCVKRYGG